MGEDYLTTARAKGLEDKVVRRRHAVPNALLPTVTLIFLNLGFVISGAITVETVFSWPGLGLLTYDALRGPDIAAAAGHRSCCSPSASSRPTSSPTCSTPCSTRGCGLMTMTRPGCDRRQPDLAPGRSPGPAGAPPAPHLARVPIATAAGCSGW